MTTPTYSSIYFPLKLCCGEPVGHGHSPLLVQIPNLGRGLVTEIRGGETADGHGGIAMYKALGHSGVASLGLDYTKGHLYIMAEFP
jgi:hypothetical protein